MRLIWSLTVPQNCLFSNNLIHIFTNWLFPDICLLFDGKYLMTFWLFVFTSDLSGEKPILLSLLCYIIGWNYVYGILPVFNRAATLALRWMCRSGWCVNDCASIKYHTAGYEPLARYLKLRVVHAPGMPGTFSRQLRVSYPDMPWCMPGSLTSGFLLSRWSGKRSRHSRRMRNPQFYVSGKRPMGQIRQNNSTTKHHKAANYDALRK